MTLEEKLTAGLDSLGFSNPADLAALAMRYQALLLKWNKVTNLTAITDPERIITHHLLDAYSVNRFIRGTSILDVGSGAGIPGIPLALANPDKDFILLDPNGKKTRFMTQAKIELGLENVEVVQARAEDHDRQYDQVISRAFRQVEGFIATCGRLVRPGGTLLAMKGPDHMEELATLSGFEDRVATHLLSVPGLDADRFLVEITC